MPLTDTTVRNAKVPAKAVKLFDERGLYVELSPTGGKLWRLKYRFAGKEKRLALGVYPDVSLKQAREGRDSARALLAQGVDPSEHRKAAKAGKRDRATNSFEIVTREWLSKYGPSFAAGHRTRVDRLFERDLFPWLGERPIAEVTSPELLETLRRIESRGALDTAHRARQTCGQIFRYAIATGRAEHDPSRDLLGALPPVKGKHFAATLEPRRLAEILTAMHGYEGTVVVRAALRLAPMLFVRPGELRRAEWAHIDLQQAEWRYRVTKTSVDHLVPLPRQAVAVLTELRPLTGFGRFVFPGARTSGRPMSDNAVLAAMRRLGIAKEEMTGHGFRAVARTLLDESLGVRADFIEHQLAHAVRDPNGRAYNRTAHLVERRKMMQEWADYIDALLSNPKAVVEKIGGVA
jgi:integrase